MSIIEQATKRLEELERAGVLVPRAAAGVAQSDAEMRVESKPLPDDAPGYKAGVPTLEGAIRRHEIASAAPIAAARRVAQPRADGGRHPTTVTIDLERLEGLGYLVPTQARSVLADEFGHIKRPLLKNARSRDSAANRLSLIMVTSSLPGEGKTFCAINLAMSMSVEIDTSVLLVDADVMRPEVLKRLGVQANKGLLDLLTDHRLGLSDVVLETNVPKLAILPAGTRNSISTELLASEAMGSLLVELTERYPDRIVIFDAPPMLVTSEAKVLAEQLGQVVLVVEAAGTPRNAVLQSFAALEQCPIVMTVLNKAPESAVALGYGYY